MGQWINPFLWTKFIWKTIELMWKKNSQKQWNFSSTIKAKTKLESNIKQFSELYWNLTNLYNNWNKMNIKLFAVFVAFIMMALTSISSANPLDDSPAAQLGTYYSFWKKTLFEFHFLIRNHLILLKSLIRLLTFLF